MATAPTKMCYIPWMQWPDSFARSLPGREFNNSEDTTKARPRYFTITPDGKMQVYPTPDKKYIMHFYCNSAIQELDDELDSPFLPEHLHMMIVWKAVMEYAMYHVDRSVLERARSKYRVFKKLVEDRWMPDIKFITDALYRNLC